MPTFKKPLTIPSSLTGKSTLTSHNNNKTVYYKQQTKNDVCKKSDSFI